MNGFRSLDKKLWKLVSEYVRRREAGPSGFTRCVTCNGFDHWKQMDAGHFMKSRFLPTKYSLKNVHPQCKICNQAKDGQQSIMGLYIDRKYGRGTADELIKLAHSGWLPDIFWYERQIADFREKLRLIR